MNEMEEARCKSCNIDLGIFIQIKSVSKRLYNRGLILAQEKQLTEAYKTLLISIKLDKSNITARNLLGLILYEMGNVGEAIKQWVISINLSKEDNIAQRYLETVNLGSSETERLNEAVKLYNESIEYFNQKNEDLAIIKLKKSIHKNPKFLQAYNLLALAYMKEDDFENARNTVLTVLSMDLNNKDALYYMRKYIKDDKYVHKSSVKKQKTFNKEKKRESTAAKGFKVFKSSVAGMVLGSMITALILLVLVVPAWNEVQIRKYKQQITVQQSEMKVLQNDKETLQEEFDEIKLQLSRLEEEKGELQEAQLKSVVLDQLANLEQLVSKKNYIQAEQYAISIKQNETLLSSEQQKRFVTLQESIQKNIVIQRITEGTKAFDAGQYEQTITLLGYTLQSDLEYPNRDRALYIVGKAFFKLRQYDDANKAFNIIIEKHPNSGYVKYARNWIASIPQ